MKADSMKFGCDAVAAIATRNNVNILHTEIPSNNLILQFRVQIRQLKNNNAPQAKTKPLAYCNTQRAIGFLY